MRYLIYARVSEKGSAFIGGADETSIPDQVAECRAYVLTRDPGAHIQVIQDEFRSGGDNTRPGWKRIVHDLATDSGGWDCLVVRNIARLTRSAESIPVLKNLRDRDRGLIATRENIDLSSPYGRAFLHILIALAQADREDKAEQTKMRMVAKASHGQWVVGKTPFGYRRPAPKNNVLQVVPDQAETVRDIFRQYLAGAGPVQIARAHGMKLNTVWHILSSKAYKGVIDYDGKEYPGMHTPIVTPQDWDAAQQRLGPANSIPRAQTVHTYLLAGLVECSCGHRMTCYSSRGKSGQSYAYYQCNEVVNCKQRVPAEEIETAVLSALRQVEYTPGEVDRIIAEIRRLARADALAAAPERAEIERDLAKAQGELESASRVIENGGLDKDNAEYFNGRLREKRLAVTALQQRLDLLAEKSRGESWRLLESVAAELPRLPAMLDRLKDDPAQLRLLITAHVTKVKKTDDTWDVVLATTGTGLASQTNMATPRVAWLTLCVRPFSLTIKWPSNKTPASPSGMAGVVNG